MDKFLSAEDLRSGRTLPRNLPDRGGEKFCTTTDDQLGARQLDYFLDERKTALAEPKVEKLSSLIKGEWLQDVRAIRIVKNVGKHLQHLGYSEKGERMLYPEEALYLMDAKCMVVYYRDLPLSCQEAYNLFFTHPADLLRYQVYCHLCRLGYIVVRHQGRMGVTDYERKMKVNQYSVRKSRRPALSNEATITKLGVDHKLSSEMLTNDHTSSSSQMMDVEITSKIHPSNTLEYKPSILSRYPEITVPNVYGKRLYAILAPNRSYLPEHVIYRKEMYMIDLKKLYARENMPNTAFMSHSLKRNPLMRESLAHRYVETKSWHEEQKEYKRRKLNNTWKGSNKIHQRFHKVSHSASHRHSHNGTNSRQQNGNVDKTVQSSCSWITTKDETCYSGTYSSAIPNTINGPLKSKIKTGAKSWKQYKKELETSTDPNESQSCVIATSTCQPLLNFRNATDASSILHQLQIVKQLRLQDYVSSPSNLLELAYDVYLPGVNYKRSKQMIPNHRLVITSVLEPLPKIDQIIQTQKYYADDVPVLFAVVDNGDIAFYSFHDVSVAVDVVVADGKGEKAK